MDDRKIALRLNNKKQSGHGIASFALGIASLIFFLSAVGISAFGNRNLDSNALTIGIIEIIGLITCIVGLIYGFIGELSKETFKTFAHIGLGINIILMLFHALVIIYGFGG